MTRKSRRDIENRLAEIETTPSEPLTFAEFFEYYYYCVEEHGALANGPKPEEFAGRDLGEDDSVGYWRRMIRVWDGEEEPPSTPDDWEWWET